MSTSLILLIPVILLAIVGLLCFVGCILPAYEAVPPWTEYTPKTILLNSHCIAYWPLKEAADTVPAAELISGNTGNYIDPTTAASLYPWPAYSVPNGANPDVLSAAAPGDIKFAQPGIVAGDVVQPLNDPVPAGCMVVNGCYVEVPWNKKFIPTESFTVEAWVRPDWSGSDPQADRFVLDSRDLNPGTGFALYAQADPNQSGVYHWAGIMGNGASGSEGFTIVAGDEIKLGSVAMPAKPVYLALTYDAPNQTLTFYVNGGGEGGGIKVTSVAYMANTTQPLWIGAGSPYVTRRPQPVDILASPLFPFVGAIQDVAIYNDVLNPGDIVTHFNNGNGTDPK
jgi:hypothetical protein